MHRIYLDNNASTPIDDEVRKAIFEELTNPLLNPSSSHEFGQKAKIRLDLYRREIAAFFDLKPREVVFTSSGTESMNFLIRGFVKGKKGHLISSSAEHSCVIKVLEELEKEGIEVTYLNPGPTGAITPLQVSEVIRPNTLAIVLMAANNETGVKTDLEGIASMTTLPLIVDGVAWLGKEKINFPKTLAGIGFSSHKVHAPPGTGLAILKQKFQPLILGGSQEGNLRAGTENMLGIAAFHKALQVLSYPDPLLRDTFENILLKNIPGAKVNGTGPRISNTSNIHFPNIDGETLLIKLDQAGVMASLGSACTSGALEPSKVLLSMGLSYKEAKSSLRFSFSRMNTVEEVKEAAEIVVRASMKYEV